MTHPVRLETESGHFVVAGTLHFQTLPTIIVWGQRIFALYEAGALGFPSRYRERFAVALTYASDVDPIPAREPKAIREA